MCSSVKPVRVMEQIQGTKRNCNQMPRLQDEVCWHERVDVDVLLLLSSGEMGKNKQKGKKTKTVFQVANKHLKHKNKAKPVTTTLKHVCPVLATFHFLFSFQWNGCRGNSSVIFVSTDQCGQKREGGEPESNLHTSSEGCEEHLKVCRPSAEETDTGRTFRSHAVH